MTRIDRYIYIFMYVCRWVGGWIDRYCVCVTIVRTLVNLNALFIPSARFLSQALRAYGEYPPYSGTYWGLPFFGDVQLMLYRRSAFDRFGFLPPSTLEELLAQV